MAEMLHPHTAREVEEILARATADGTRVLPVGGRTHMDRGNPCEVDVELWTTQLDELVSYEPAEMVAVVGAGMHVRDLQSTLVEGGQEWACDAPGDATVGGVIAAGVSSPRRLKVGAIRDTVLEVELVTGDGRLVKGGGRVVKNVTGYDLPRLAAGSLGTLGVIVQVALKVRPLPKARRTLTGRGDGLALGSELLERVPGAAAVLASSGRVELRLEGWPGEVEEQTAAARSVTRELEIVDDAPFPMEPLDAAEVVVEAAVPPSKIRALVAEHTDWTAALGVGLVWLRLDTANGDLASLRGRAAALGGIAPVIRGPGGLGDTPLPALEVHRRLKRSFDPGNVLAPGRFWGEL